MKHLIKYMFAICVFAGMATACNDDFMQQDPDKQLAEGSFLKNEGDLPIYLNGLYDLYVEGHGRGNGYAAMPPIASRGSIIAMPDLFTDNAVAYTSTAGNPNTHLDGSWLVPASEPAKTSEVTSNDVTGWNWTSLKQVNYFLRHVHDADGSVASPTDLNKWIAEAYFFKAWDYYQKLYIFGEVPWFPLDLNVNSPELYNPRTPRAELVDSIMYCLDFAVNNIKVGGAADGRINRDMANFLKARFCLFEGTYRKYHTELNLQSTANRFLEAAATACEAIIASPTGYELFQAKTATPSYLAFENNLDSYWQMFGSTQSPAAAGNKEAILARVYDGDKYGTGMSRYYIMNGGNASGRYSKGATKAFVDDYLCIDGQPISSSPLFKGYDGADWRELDNRDPRLTQTVEKPGTYLTIFDRDKAILQDPTVISNWWYPSVTYNCPTANQDVKLRSTVTGYTIIKHMTTAFSANGSTNKGNQTAIVFRYGEVLIMLAEAKAELGTLTNSDLDRTVNKLRERAGFDFTAYPDSKLTLANVPSDTRLDAIWANAVDYTVSPILREIRRERRIEMAQEGLRREDLVRWKAGKLMEVPLRGVKFTAEKQALYDGSNNGTSGKPYARQAKLDNDVFVDADGFIIAFPKAPYVTNGTLKWEDKYYAWPIPLQELELNKALTQSPGWTDINR
jgi:hypothetical protein